MGKIKVAQIITRMDWGGSPDIVRVLCTHLDPGRYAVTVFTGRTRFASVKTRGFLESFAEKIVVVPGLRRQINPLRDLRAFYALKTLIKRGGYELVHTHTAKAGFLGRIAASSVGVGGIIHTPHGHNLYGYFNPFFTRCISALERYASARCDKIIAQTSLEREELIRSHIARPEQLTVIPQGVELPLGQQQRGDLRVTETRQALGLIPGDRVVTMIGRLERVKGVEFFLESAVQCCRREKGVTFLLVGEGSLRQAIRARIVQEGLREKIIMPGWRDDIGGILSFTDILVLPSLNEAVGMALIEAQGSGVPVIASRTGGIPEILRDGETGLLIPPSDAAALTEAIFTLLHDEQRRRIMGQQARLWVQDRFSVEKMVRATERLYEGLVVP